MIPKFLANIDNFNTTITFEQLVSKHGKAKAAAYRRGFQQACNSSKIPTELEVLQKTNELAYNDDLKPRNLFNPSWELKAMGSYIGQWFIEYATKHIDGFMVGYNTEKLQEKFTANYNSITNPVIVTWDGSNHDAHQFAELIDTVDTPFIEACFDKAYSQCVDMPGWNIQLKESLLEALTKIDLKARMFGKDASGKRTTILSVLMKGTVFSGHPTRTTLGNTLRVLTYAYFVAHLAGIPDSEFKLHVAGDDLAVILNRKYLKKFQEAYNQVYINEKLLKIHDDKKNPKLMLSHGLGQVGKAYGVAINKIDFLSKTIYIHEARRQILCNRKITRVLLSGNTSNRIKTESNPSGTLTPEEYNWAITASIESYGYSWPVLKQYIALRKKTLNHWRPSRLEVYQECGYDFAYLSYHKNTYNFENDEMFLKYNLGHAQIVMAEESTDLMADILTAFPINE